MHNSAASPAQLVQTAISGCPRLAKRACLVGPGAETAGDEVRDDVADVLFLRRLVVGARIVTGDRHGPASLALLQFLQEARGVVDIPGRIEHRSRRSELVAVIVMVDLHAAEIDQLDALAAHRLEISHGVVDVPGEYGLPFGAERERV